MKLAAFLALEEIAKRKARFAGAVTLVAMIVAFCVFLELTARAREGAIRDQLDSAGPAITAYLPVLATAINDGDQANAPKGKALLRGLERSTAKWVRAIEGRLQIDYSLNGKNARLIGIAPGALRSQITDLDALGPGQAVLGSEAARRFGLKEGDRIDLMRRSFLIAKVLSTSGDRDDVGIFLKLSDLQELAGRRDQINTFRFFPATAADQPRLTAFLQRQYPTLRLERNVARDEASVNEMENTLSLHKRVIVFFSALVVALSLGIGTYLNANERRTELATLVALGGTAYTVLALMAVRSFVIGIVGGTAGFLLGGIIGWSRIAGFSPRLLFAVDVLFFATVGTAVLCALVAVLASIRVAGQDPVAQLQKSF